MACDLAKATERVLQYELATDESFISFGHWDSLKKGLLAGETLMLELNRMEKAYLERNARRLEIERTISLLQLNPQAILDLKTHGVCELELSERFFAQDYPGHYCRQIKSIALTIPAIVGPYQSVKATLTQLGNKTLLTSDPNAARYLLGQGEAVEPDNRVLRVNWKADQQVAISRAVTDNGLFELTLTS